MRLLIFIEGTILMHAGGAGRSRAEAVRQVQEGHAAVSNLHSYVPVQAAQAKVQHWEAQGAEIHYLTSQRDRDDISVVLGLLQHHGFPVGVVHFRGPEESYAHVAERVGPDVIIEDDCESIGGEAEMVHPNLQPQWQQAVLGIRVPEFGGIDHLSDSLRELVQLSVREPAF